MRMRTVLLGAAVVGAGYLLWRRPATQRFVATVRDAATEREAQLREAVETAVREDATTRAPRHAAGARVPDLDVDAGWDRDRPALADGDRGRSLSPEEARALLLDPAGHARADGPDGGRAR
ncbi:hypothetical protein [Phycicoccus sonneratiae]|uniref:Uncharacterized protein n=1 Tax=Phycicoccus sonneratiae TaxID=2807628 RepID=A0ABS2CHS3_9MICO|nr:hypothetical protein [Phycicoccus sonneraticus]MBM6399413.1 hypothetical protein [Phycicoccus sonneraticus]